jgi:hypothetical protein
LVQPFFILLIIEFLIFAKRRFFKKRVFKK